MWSIKNWKAPAAIAAIVAAGTVGFLGNTPATAATGGPDDDGRLLLAAGQVVPAGGVFSGFAQDLQRTQVFHVQPFPISPVGCHMITTNEETVSQNSSRVSMFWQVKNISSTPCSFDVLLSYTS
jgi:hypothetical protein